MDSLILTLIGTGIGALFHFLVGKRLAKKLAVKWSDGRLDRFFRQWNTPIMTVVIGWIFLAPQRALNHYFKPLVPEPFIVIHILLSAVITCVFLVMWGVLAEFIHHREQENKK